MTEFIEKLIARLEEELTLADKEKERCVKENPLQFDSAKGYASGVSMAIEIVNKLAEEYNNGWIPCSERLPEEEGKYLVTLKLGCITFADLKDIKHYPHFNADVIAWQPIPQPYQPKGEK